MKVLLMKLLLAGLCLLFLAPSLPAAETKIATIDLSKVFNDYYKRKLADAAIQEEISGLEKDRKSLIEDHQKATEEYKKIRDEANNQAVSADEREKRKKEEEAKLVRINDLRQTIEQFDRTAKGQMEEKLVQTRNKLVNEIKNIVSIKAKSGGFTLVFDSSASEPGGRPPTVIYTSGENDLTAAVLAELNANAPADLPNVDDKKGGKKDEKK